jgi:hypothetical protein
MAKKTLAQLEAEAYGKHGPRAGALLSLVGTGRATKASWQKVIDAPVDEYAEARHEQWQQSLRVKFPQFFGGTTP